MIRVLHIFHNMSNGGIENFVMNNYRNIDRERVQFDFLTSVEEPGYFDEEIKSMGGKIYHAYPKSKSLIKNFQSISSIVRDGGYKVVHRHTGSAFSNIDLIAAKHGGADVLISHSHSTKSGHALMHYFGRTFFKVDTINYACSKEAGEWLFGKNKVKEGKVSVIKNAVNTERFEYNPEVRNALREKYDANGKFIIGHVGNYNIAKNHKFIVRVFNQLLKDCPNAELWLIGDGELKPEVDKQIAELGIGDHIKQFGVRKDVNELLQAMDVFFFPSTYEGFGIVAIEAQCSGLKVITSTNCVPEINLTGNVRFFDLEDPVEQWVIALLDANTDYDRTQAAQAIRDAGYDLKSVAKDLQQKYEEYAKS